MSLLPADLGDGGSLRRLTLDDLDEVWAAIESERERLGTWMPFVEHTRTLDDERMWLAAVAANEDTLEGCGMFVDGRYAGGVGLVPRFFDIEGEIGYWIVAGLEGRGYVTRAVRVLIDVGFREWGLHRIIIRAGVQNHRSRAIPERLGFTREGIARGASRGTMGFHDLVVYSMLEDEWEARAR